MYNILDYGAMNNRNFDSTPGIRKAVEACRANGGGVVYIPFGVYTVGSVQLYSNVHVVFEAGAMFYGHEDPDKFEPREVLDYPLYQDASHSYFHHSMFWAEDCENISITGLGTIDMQHKWEKQNTPGEKDWTGKRAVKIIALKNCKNIAIYDLTLLHATDLAVYLAGCERVRISKLNIDTDIDGISPDCCKDVVISDCVIRSGDDSIVLKSSYTLNEKRICENIAVTNCVVSARANAIKLGTESNGGYKNISISNCVVRDTYYSGISLEVTDGGELDGVTISNISMQNVGYPIFIILSDRARGPEGTKIGSLKNVIIDQVTAIGPYKPFLAPQMTALWAGEQMDMPCLMPSSVTGQPYAKVENITLSNLTFEVPGGGTEEDRNMVVPEITNIYPENDRFGNTLPAYGIYFRHVKNLTLSNINIKTMNPDARDMFVFDDVENYTVK